jgi:hypothetical protein
MISEDMAKRILRNVAADKVTEKDRKDWNEHGHLIMSWLRNQITGEDDFNVFR